MLTGGQYGDMTRFSEVSQSKRFTYDRGLPGKCWAKRRPLLLKTNSPEFERREAAQAAGITTAIAWPTFAGDYLLGVTVFLCGGDEESLGALEIWHCDSNESYDMRLVDGYFGQMKRFELVSKVTAFRKGTGLVGEAWQAGLPVMQTDLGRSHRFIRSEGAAEAGLTTGLAIPMTLGDNHDFVLSFLSARATPIARQFEVWLPGPTGTTLTFDSGYSEAGIDLTNRYRELKLSIHDGMLGRALLTGVPNVTNELRETPAQGLEYLSSATVLPVLEKGRAKALVAIYNG